MNLRLPTAFAAFILLSSVCSAADTGTLSFPAKGESQGKIVLVAGDEEYRSEESMPMLAKILSVRHGFDCVVLFSMSVDGSYIDPNNQEGLSGLENLDDADLMIIGTRFRKPSASQAKHVTTFLDSGKPVIGIRTSTHAFRGNLKFGTLDYGEFGRQILGETWVSHHGKHKKEGARGVVVKENEGHPILNSVADVFAPSDVYGVIHLTEDDMVLMRGAVTETLDPKSKTIEGPKNDPMQPFAWLHPYESPGGKSGLSFCTTAGASVDFVSEDLRRMIVNATYYLLDKSVPERADVDYVDAFYPSFYGFIREKGHFENLNLKPEDFAMGKTPQVPDPKGSPEWNFRDTP
ncbi:MAG: hypothetical protein AAFU85_08845 [Planctomycetota bacterium]